MDPAAAQAPRWLVPDWPAPANVRALVTLRTGGGSAGPYASLNLATHVGDDPAAVAANRARLRAAASLPSEPLWLHQVHGIAVWSGGSVESPPTADASVAAEPRRVCTIMTADCLPVLFCDVDGTRVGAAHAGWRGLVGGVLAATVSSMAVRPERIIAWLGPAIEQDAFEVGAEVREEFVARHPSSATAFERNPRGRWQADLYALARIELGALGIPAVYGGGFKCFSDSDRFYSYRRDKITGRMATMVWME